MHKKTEEVIYEEKRIYIDWINYNYCLLAVIVVISFVSINKVVEKEKVNSCEAIINNITAATNEYVSDNRYKDEFIKDISYDNKVFIYVDDLIDSNYLTSSLFDPFTKKKISTNEVNIDVSLKDDYSVENISINDGNFLYGCSINEYKTYVRTSNTKPTIQNNDDNVDNVQSNSNKEENVKAYLVSLPSDIKSGEYNDKIENIYFVNYLNVSSNKDSVAKKFVEDRLSEAGRSNQVIALN